MRTIIAGTRTFNDRALLGHVLEGLPWIVSEVVSGCAPGADTLGEQWAAHHGLPVAKYPADWRGLGRRAGPMRNQIMAENADAAVLFWDGESAGTADMMKRVTIHRLRLILHVFTVPIGVLNPKVLLPHQPPPLPPGAPHA